MDYDLETITKVSVLLDAAQSAALTVNRCTPIGDPVSKIVEVSFVDAECISSCMSLITNSLEKVKILLGLPSDFSEQD